MWCVIYVNSNCDREYIFKCAPLLKGMSDDTIYDRVAKLEDEVAVLREEMNVIKGLMKNKLAKLEIKKVKQGYI